MSRLLALTFASFTVALLALAGCGDGRPAVFPVRGQVVDAKGKPAAGATIVFHPATGNHKPVATTDAEGKYALTTFNKDDGAPVGDYTISMEWPTPRKTPFEPAGPDQLNGRFRDPKTSKLTAKVENRDNDVPPIRLP